MAERFKVFHSLDQEGNVGHVYSCKEDDFETVKAELTLPEGVVLVDGWAPEGQGKPLTKLSKGEGS